MGRNGREYVVKNPSWETVAKKVSEICESVIIKSQKTKMHIKIDTMDYSNVGGKCID